MQRGNSGTLRFGVAGFSLEISVWFCASLCLVLLTDASGEFAWCMLAAGLHEGGHILAIAATNGYPCSVRFTPLGIRLNRTVTFQTATCSEMAVHLAGPAMNLCACAVMELLRRWIPAGQTWLIGERMQLVLGGVNLLPIVPLDGGHALQAFLTRCIPKHADLICTLVGGFLLLPLLVSGLLVLFQSKYNWSLLGFAVYATVFFIFEERS